MGVFPYIEMYDFGNIPSEMINIVIPTGKYAVFTHIGLLDNLEETYQFIFNAWKRENNYKIKNSDQFEVYDDKFIEGDTDSEMDNYIAII